MNQTPNEGGGIITLPLTRIFPLVKGSGFPRGALPLQLSCSHGLRPGNGGEPETLGSFVLVSFFFLSDSAFKSVS